MALQLRGSAGSGWKGAGWRRVDLTVGRFGGGKGAPAGSYRNHGGPVWAGMGARQGVVE